MNTTNLAKKLSTLLIVALCTFGFTNEANAQRIAYIDLNKILENLDEYQNAQQELDRIAAKWRQELAQEYDVIRGMYNRYQAEQVLLSEEARKQKEDEIMIRDKAVQDLQKKYFGPEGDLFKRRQALVRPIQDRVYAVIEAYANDRGYDFIFDKSSNVGMIFSNPQYDKTEDILQRLN